MHTGTNGCERPLVDAVHVPNHHGKVIAVGFIHHGDNFGFSRFTGAGYPKVVPAALAAAMVEAHEDGREFQVGLWTGASTAPDADGVLATAHGLSTRLPYNSDPTLRAMINAGDVRYIQPAPPCAAPQQPTDVRDIIHVPNGQLAPRAMSSVCPSGGSASRVSED